MQTNSWENVKTGTWYGCNTILGNPRGWLQRAVGVKQADLGLHASSLQPNAITVAGIWPRTAQMPDSQSWPAIYRYFSIVPDLRRANRARPEEFYPVIGMGIAVPGDQAWEYYRSLKTTGAEWLWFDLPGPLKSSNAGQHAPLPDHEELYSLFDAGRTPRELSRERNLVPNSVYYVFRKWQAGLSPARKERATVDHEQVIQDLRLGISPSSLTQKYGVSRSMIHKIKQKAVQNGQI
jgi:Mor family transcriptional regulator